MSDDLRGPAKWLVSRLPPAVVERWFLPWFYESQAERLIGSEGRPLLTRVARSALFHVKVVFAAVECALRATAEARRTQVARKKGFDPMLIHDLRLATRMLWKNPGFTSIATIALALGIGANTAIFSIVHAVLLRPLSFAQPDRILELSETVRGGVTTISPPNLLDWKAQTTVFSRIAAYDDGTATLSGGFEPEQLDAAFVDEDVFPVLGVSPFAGRAFAAEDMKVGGPRVMMLGYGTWQRRFGADRSVVGRLLTFDGRQFEVIGIMPRGFTFPRELDVWFPLRLTSDDTSPNQRGAHYLNAIGRLKEGATVQQAVDDLSRIESAIAAQFPSVQGYGIWARPLLDSMVGGVRRPLLMLLGAVGFVLLIACANVSNLLLARAGARRTELAVRSALGAGRWRIVRQLLAESLLLAIAGAMGGLLLAAWGVRALDVLLPQDLPRADGIGINISVLLFTMLASIGSAVLAGVIPAVHASAVDTAAFLKDARRDGGSIGSRRRSRAVLVAAEVALALVLLTGAALALRSFARLSSVDPGFDPGGTLAFDLSVPDSRYPDSSAVARFYQQVIDAIGSDPRVVAAGAVMRPPLARSGFGGSFTIVGAEASDRLNVQIRPATAGYFEALRIPLKRGRLFTPADRDGSLPVAIISEEAARRFWPGRDPIGQQLRLHVSIMAKEPVREVIGVVGDVKHRTLEAGPSPHAYVPHGQYVSSVMTVFVRTNADPLSLAPAMKAHVAALDREVAPSRIRRADRLIASAVAQPRFRLILLAIFGVIAVTLAAVGLYGVMAFSVTQRTGEIGVRMALGANRTDVMRLVLGQALVPVAVGIAAGLLGAAALTQILTGLLFQVSPLDPVAYIAVVILLGTVAVAACYIPARRATRVDPLATLRAQ